MSTSTSPGVGPATPDQAPRSSFRGWLLSGMEERGHQHQGPHGVPAPEHRRHAWWRVMCLTGVDYFSTLGYQPGIAALAAGLLSPLATLVLVALTLFGALPVYRRVAEESPHGEGSIAMLERLLSFWQGKLFVLVLLGFAATDFLITMTLSAADATAHVVENPHIPGFLHDQQMLITLVLLGALGAVFLRGFKEAIGLAVVLVGVYLALNAVVVGYSLWEVATSPTLVTDWTSALTKEHGNPLAMVGIALLVFPKLALGLSGFETGVAVMPQVEGDPTDTEVEPTGRIRGAKRLLTTAAHHERLPGGEQHRHHAPHPGPEVRARWPGQRARARLPRPRGARHRLRHRVRRLDDRDPVVRRCLGDGGDAQPHPALPAPLRHGAGLGPGSPASGAGAHCGRVPRHLDLQRQRGRAGRGLRHRGPGPDDVGCRGRHPGRRRAGQRWRTVGFALVAAVFVYTTIDNVVERPDGVKIGACFIAAIIGVSLWSRVSRAFEPAPPRSSWTRPPIGSCVTAPAAASVSSPTSPTPETPRSTSRRCARWWQTTTCRTRATSSSSR
ncbi:hypothetical protein [Nocardioides ungokensis]|uniref:hypothetical protein n=1 Tax=Nocardioides ungokensis TaxID=1643322 RepID=UPI0031B5CB84